MAGGVSCRRKGREAKEIIDLLELRCIRSAKEGGISFKRMLRFAVFGSVSGAIYLYWPSSGLHVLVLLFSVVGGFFIRVGRLVLYSLVSLVVFELFGRCIVPRSFCAGAVLIELNNYPSRLAIPILTYHRGVVLASVQCGTNVLASHGPCEPRYLPVYFLREEISLLS